jgi:hypothetical protein
MGHAKHKIHTFNQHFHKPPTLNGKKKKKVQHIYILQKQLFRNCFQQKSNKHNTNQTIVPRFSSGSIKLPHKQKWRHRLRHKQLRYYTNILTRNLSRQNKKQKR